MTDRHNAAMDPIKEFPRALAKIATVGLIAIALLLCRFYFTGESAWDTPILIGAYVGTMAVVFLTIGKLRNRFVHKKSTPGASA